MSDVTPIRRKPTMIEPGQTVSQAEWNAGWQAVDTQRRERRGVDSHGGGTQQQGGTMSKRKKNRWDAFTFPEIRQLHTGDVGPDLGAEMQCVYEARIEGLAGASPQRHWADPVTPDTPTIEEVRAAATAAAISRAASDGTLSAQLGLRSRPVTRASDDLREALDELGRVIVSELRLREATTWLARRIKRP